MLGRALRLALAVLAYALVLPLPSARAQALPAALRSIVFSTDVNVETGKALSARDDCIITFSSSMFFAEDLCFALLDPTDIDAAQYTGYPGEVLQTLYSFDTSLLLSNGQVAHPADVVLVVGDQQMIYFDHEFSGGLPDAANIDAIAETPGLDLLLSFDTTVVITRLGTLTVNDEDLVLFPAGGGVTPTIFFDGSEHGVAAALDLDAAHLLPDGRLLLSFDTSGTVPGPNNPTTFADEDVLLFDPVADSWEMFWDSSTFDPALERADLDAIAGVELAQPTPTSTPLATSTATATQTLTASATATATSTGAATATATSTSAATATATSTGSATATATSTGAATATATATGAATATPTTPGGGPTQTPTLRPCPGDCNGNRIVAINELILGVNIALNSAALAQCPPFDNNADGTVGITDLITAVGAALNGCP